MDRSALDEVTAHHTVLHSRDALPHGQSRIEMELDPDIGVRSLETSGKLLQHPLEARRGRNDERLSGPCCGRLHHVRSQEQDHRT